MKLVINTCYGGFETPEGFDALYSDEDNFGIDRDDPRLVEYCESHPDELKFGCTHLSIVELPDTATDYYINEYDGAEEVIYVLNGKLHWL